MGAGGEMNQALYAHMNNKRKKNNLLRTACIFLNERVYRSLFFQLSNMKMDSYL
jgi:hypothetical protein